MFFSDVIGHNDVKQHLTESVRRGKVPHATMLYGPEGVGKLPLAIAYARYLNCSNRSADDSCGECPSCHKFNKLAHPDLHFVFPVIKSKVSDDYLPQWREFLSSSAYFNLNQWLTYINAENAQGVIYSKESDEIIRKLNLKVYEAPYKIMIIWLPEKMHVACANKLLKMIEEPPGETVFLLISEDRENVLQTIWSRCQPLHIHSIGKSNHFLSQIDNSNRFSHVKNKNLPSIPHKGSLQHQLAGFGYGHKVTGNFGMGDRNRSSLCNLTFEQGHHRTIGAQNIAKTSGYKGCSQSG